jgi:hypothetical protein
MPLKFEEKKWKTTVIHEPDCPDYVEANIRGLPSRGWPCDNEDKCKNYDESECYEKAKMVEVDPVIKPRTFWEYVCYSKSNKVL